jgi:hypothetical protein
MTPPFGLAPGKRVDQRSELAAPVVDRVRLAQVRRVDLGDVADRGERDRSELQRGIELLLQARLDREGLARCLPAKPLFASIRHSEPPLPCRIST